MTREGRYRDAGLAADAAAQIAAEIAGRRLPAQPEEAWTSRL